MIKKTNEFKRKLGGDNIKGKMNNMKGRGLKENQRKNFKEKNNNKSKTSM